MKKYSKITIIVACAIALLPSCEDIFGDFLDKQPSNELTQEQVFSLWSNAEKFHFDTYNFLRHGAGRINNSWNDAATDLAQTSYSWGGVRTSFNIGNYYAEGGAPELVSTWEHYYRGVRKCNMTLEHIDSVPKAASTPQDVYQKDLMNFKAEARFLRSYFYWELFVRYGPVPLVTTVLDPDGDLLAGYTTRPSVKTFVDYLLQELTACEPNLMDKPTEANLIGRICKPMAAALRSRIMLYMASPRFAAEGVCTWQEAADAANSFITTYGSQYGLYYGTSGNAQTRYAEAVLLPAHAGNNEVIFWRNDTQAGWSAVQNDTPVGEGGNGGACPSQNLVDMYDMANGQSPFATYDETGCQVGNAVNAASGYAETAPYTAREPRFYASVLYNGAQWNNRTINVVKGGADNPANNANATPTGYYLRKYMPENILANTHAGTAYRNWIFIRYAEILLNYAEALNEAQGPTSAVFAVLQQIRDRAGLTALLSARADLQTQEALRNFIRKERTVELAFEDARAWDVRRWNVAQKALGSAIYGMEVVDNAGTLTFTRKVVAERTFASKMYLYPIPETEVWKTNIQNNTDW